MLDRPRLIAVFVGGCLGALLRSALVEIADVGPGVWPWPTFVVNIAGAALLGWLSTRPDLTTENRALWGSGFCGALTTFSTLQVEIVELADDGHAGLAVAYCAATFGLGLLVVGAIRRGATA